jgi:hypothetical protein
MAYTIKIYKPPGAELEATLSNPFDASYTQQLNELGQLEFSLPADDAQCQYLLIGNEVWLYIDDVFVDCFRISERETTKTKEKKAETVVCFQIGDYLNRQIEADYKWADELPSTILEEVLALCPYHCISLGGVDEELDVLITVDAKNNSLWAICQDNRDKVEEAVFGEKSEAIRTAIYVECNSTNPRSRKLYFKKFKTPGGITGNTRSITYANNLAGISRKIKRVATGDLYLTGPGTGENALKLDDYFVEDDVLTEALVISDYVYLRLPTGSTYQDYVGEGDALPEHVTVYKDDVEDTVWVQGDDASCVRCNADDYDAEAAYTISYQHSASITVNLKNWIPSGSFEGDEGEWVWNNLWTKSNGGFSRSAYAEEDKDHNGGFYYIVGSAAEDSWICSPTHMILYVELLGQSATLPHYVGAWIKRKNTLGRSRIVLEFLDADGIPTARTVESAWVETEEDWTHRSVEGVPDYASGDRLCRLKVEHDYIGPTGDYEVAVDDVEMAYRSPVLWGVEDEYESRTILKTYEELLSYGRSEATKRWQAQVEYKIDVVDLSKIDPEVPKFALGDEVHVTDTDLGWDFYDYVTRISVPDLANPLAMEIEVTNRIETLADRGQKLERKLFEWGSYPYSAGLDLKLVDDREAPAAPTGVSVEAIFQAIRVSWVASTSTDVAHYVIYRHTSDDSGNSTAIAVVDGLKWIDYCGGGQTFYYWVKAVDFAANYSPFSSPAATTTSLQVYGDGLNPNAPTGLTATGIFGGIRLTWTASTSADVKGYKIYRNTTNNPDTASVIGTVDALSFIDAVAVGATRYYWVSAIDYENLESAKSTGASATSQKVTGSDVTLDTLVASLFKKSLQPYNSNLTFVPYASDPTHAVSWGAGIITFADGTSQNINGDHSGLLTAGVRYYIYFTVGSGTLTVTSTYSDCWGDNKGLLCEVYRSTIESDAEIGIQPYASKGINLIADFLAVKALSAIVANLGTITAGLLQSQNWGASQGMLIDLNNELIKLGGSSDPDIVIDAGASPPTIELRNLAVAKGVGFSRAFWHGIEWQTFFESLDGFGTVGNGSASIHLATTFVRLETGATSGSQQNLRKQRGYPAIQHTWVKPRRFRTKINLSSITNQTVWVCTGLYAINPHVGFKIVNNTLYGCACNGTTESTVSLQTIAASTDYLLECIFDPDATDKCLFYVNDVYKGCLSSNIPTGTSQAEIILEVLIQNDAAADKQIVLSDWLFLQEPE